MRSSKGSEGLPNRGVPWVLVRILQTLRIVWVRMDDGLRQIAPVFLKGLGKRMSTISSFKGHLEAVASILPPLSRHLAVGPFFRDVAKGWGLWSLLIKTSI